jgi:hypothetical protein
VPAGIQQALALLQQQTFRLHEVEPGGGPAVHQSGRQVAQGLGIGGGLLFQRQQQVGLLQVGEQVTHAAADQQGQVVAPLRALALVVRAERRHVTALARSPERQLQPVLLLAEPGVLEGTVVVEQALQVGAAGQPAATIGREGGSLVSPRCHLERLGRMGERALHHGAERQLTVTHHRRVFHMLGQQQRRDQCRSQQGPRAEGGRQPRFFPEYFHRRSRAGIRGRRHVSQVCLRIP